MAVTVTAYETALENARAAVASSDWDTARNEVTQAVIIAAALPKTSIDGASVDYTKRAQDAFDAISEAQISASRGNRRLVSTRTAHSRRTGRGRGASNGF